MTAFRTPHEIVFDRLGTPIPRARFTFFSGTSDAILPVYSDEARTIEVSQPLVCDMAGRRPIVYLPYASSTITKYRVRCEDAMGGVIYEATLALPVASSSSSSSTASSWALPLFTETTDGGSLVLTLADATFGGLLSVNASAANVRVILPPFADISSGHSITIEQSGYGAAVIVEAPTSHKLNNIHSAWPLREAGESVTIARGLATYRALSDGLRQMVYPVASRNAAPPSTPLAGTFYLATASVAPFAENGLYRADGAGGWIEVPRRVGLLVLVGNELTSGSPRPYCWSGSAWIAWSPVSASARVFTAEYQVPSGTPGGIPVTGAWTRTDMNTVVEDGIPGASISGGAATIPAGDYDVVIERSLAATLACSIRFWSPSSGIGFRSLNAYLQGETVGLDVSGGNIVETLVTPDVSIETRVGGILVASGRVQITTPTAFELQYFANPPVGPALNTDLGAPLSITGEPEVYARVRVRAR